MLWLGADGDGVQLFDPETGRFTAVALRDAGAGPHLYKRVQSLHVDHAGAIWAGTASGLYRFDAQTGAGTLYTERDGLPSNTVSCIFEDKSGELWMGTSEGLSRLDRSRKTFKNYSLADGLPGLDFTGTPGMTVRRIRDEWELAREIRNLIDAKNYPGSALENRDQIRDDLLANSGIRHLWPILTPEPAPLLEPPPPPRSPRPTAAPERR